MKYRNERKIQVLGKVLGSERIVKGNSRLEKLYTRVTQGTNTENSHN